MNYILIVFLTYVLHLLLKLNWISTAVVLVFLHSIFIVGKTPALKQRDNGF